MGEQQDGLVGVIDVVDGETGVVLGEVDDGVLARNVGGGDDSELVPGDGRVEGDGGDAAAGDGAADGGSEPHTRQAEVVDVFGLAEDFGDPLLTDGGVAYGGEGAGLSWFVH